LITKRKEPRSKGSVSTGSGDALGTAERAVATLLTQIREARRAEAGQDPTKLLQALDSTRQSIASLTGLADAFEKLRPVLTDAAERQFLELDSTLRSECQQRGWRLDGQWPTFYVERALEVQFSERDRTVAVAGTPLDTCSIVAVSSALAPLVAILLPKSFSARTFVLQLASAYEDTRGTRTQVPVFEVYRSLVVRSQRPQFWRDARSSTFTSLTADQFRARLTRAMEEGVIDTADGRVLRLLAPLDPKDALFVYQPAEQRFGYVGRIEFLRRAEASV